MYENDNCIRCGVNLNDFEDFEPVKVPKKGEICSDCYNALSDTEKFMYFRGV